MFYCFSMVNVSLHEKLGSYIMPKGKTILKFDYYPKMYDRQIMLILDVRVFLIMVTHPRCTCRDRQIMHLPVC